MTALSRPSIASFTFGAMMWMFSPMSSTVQASLPAGCARTTSEDPVQGAGDGAVAGQVDERLAGGVVGRHQWVLGDLGEQVQAARGDDLLELGGKGAGGPVHHQVVAAHARLQLVDQVDDPAGGRQAAHRRVAHDEQQIHVAGGAPREVLEAGLVVDHDPGVARGDAVDDGAQHGVRRAVAARSLGAAHRQQVEAGALDHVGVDLVVQQVGLGHTGIEQVGARLFRGVLADVPDGTLQGQPQDVVQVAGRIGVDGEHGAGLQRRQAAHEQAGDRRLAGAALACDRDGGRHRFTPPGCPRGGRRAPRAAPSPSGTCRGRCAAEEGRGVLVDEGVVGRKLEVGHLAATSSTSWRTLTHNSAA